MAVTTYADEASLEAGISATSVTTYPDEATLASANPQPADKVLAKGMKYTVVVGGTYQDIIVKGLKYTVVT